MPFMEGRVVFPQELHILPTSPINWLDISERVKNPHRKIKEKIEKHLIKKFVKKMEKKLY